nr:VENN motif pre-toxin domain-containing protein [Rosenbergiella epipactidis]
MPDHIYPKSYYDKKPSDLSEDERQKVSALASLATGLAGGLVGGDTLSAVSGIQTGKVTVENNLMGVLRTVRKSLPGCMARISPHVLTIRVQRLTRKAWRCRMR